MVVASFFAPPAAARYALRNVRVPACLIDGPPPGPVDADGLVALDLVVADGRIAGLAPAGTCADESGADLGCSLVWPGFVDCHAHLDKAHIWPRAANPDGTHAGALAAVAADRAANWTARDVRARMEFGLACAYAHGVVAIRTHLDSVPPQAAISFPVFRAVRDAWAGRIAIQATCLVPEDLWLTDDAAPLADMTAEAGGALGCATRLTTTSPRDALERFDAAIDRMFALAEERGLDLDLHVDESGDAGARALPRIARTALRRGFKRTILCGHCCALALQPEAAIAETLAACADAGIAIVSLPACNMYLQGRAPRRTPRWRGVTVLHEIAAHGLRVAVAGDNVCDPFYAYGDHDMLDTFAQAVKILQLDHPFGVWPRAVTATPASIMGLEGMGMVRVGAAADLIVLKARGFGEMLARPQADRVVIRSGHAIDTTRPDFAVLDSVAGAP